MVGSMAGICAARIGSISWLVISELTMRAASISRASRTRSTSARVLR